MILNFFIATLYKSYFIRSYVLTTISAFLIRVIVVELLRVKVGGSVLGRCRWCCIRWTVARTDHLQYQKQQLATKPGRRKPRHSNKAFCIYQQATHASRLPVHLFLSLSHKRTSIVLCKISWYCVPLVSCAPQ